MGLLDIFKQKDSVPEKSKHVKKRILVRIW